MRVKVVLVCLLFALCSVSNGYNVYNKTKRKMKANAGTCLTCYKGTIEPGERGSCPGCGNGTYIKFKLYFPVRQRGASWDWEWGVERKCPQKVPPHGWVVISFEGEDSIDETPACRVYDENGKELTKGNPWAYPVK